ncbi:MAG: AfsR/SARP family transcriptional regulator [Streptosporangiaceae bacterium]|jgi:DNA-binding SARP family transcriptional activator
MKNSTQSVSKPLLRLYLIRGFELRSGDSVVQVAWSAQRLVAFVALQDRAVRRPHASGMLWTDAPELRASSSLRSALWRTPSPDGRPLIEASSTHLRLNPAVEVDFREIVSRAVSALDREDGFQSADSLRSQLRQFGGDLLPDWYEDWVLVERERFRQLRLHALEAICHRLTDVGRYALALEAGLAAVACEPLRESAQRQVIRAHLMEGNAAEALRQYRSYARLLADELGARPSPSMDRLLEGVTANLSRGLGDGHVTAEA